MNNADYKSMRFFRLQQELLINKKELLKLCKHLAISVKNRFSKIDACDIRRIKRKLENETPVKSENKKIKSENEKTFNSRINLSVIKRRHREKENQIVDFQNYIKEFKPFLFGIYEDKIVRKDNLYKL
jgi:hypothetical protein